jgi:c-di-AMP phosphodiesterase-like protein
MRDAVGPRLDRVAVDGHRGWRLDLRSLGSAGGMAETAELVGDLHLATVVINVQDMSRAVGFWTAALGYVHASRTAIRSS